jgi:hypothetical protein
MLPVSTHWDKCWEINVFFKARISHVLCFISICDSPSYEDGKNVVSVENVNMFWFPGYEEKFCLTAMYTRIQPNVNSTYSASMHQIGQVLSVLENIVSVAHIVQLKITSPQHPGNSS